MKLKVITLCSGYDSQCMALDMLKKAYGSFDYELVAWSEIDKYAIAAHNAVYPQWSERNLGDMTKIDWAKVKGCDLLTYSTPCTDISNAGLQKGLEKGSGTRSSILWYTEEAIRILRPKYLLMENVKALASKKFLPYLKEWQNIVAAYGYSNYTAILNAKDYGVPQNRERVFMLSIRGDETYNFPKPFKLERRLKDVLEPNVDEKYYLSDKIIIGFENSTQIAREKGNGYRFNPTEGDGYAKTILTAPGSRADDNFIIDEQAFANDDRQRPNPK